MPPTGYATMVLAATSDWLRCRLEDEHIAVFTGFSCCTTTRRSSYWNPMRRLTLVGFADTCRQRCTEERDDDQSPDWFARRVACGPARVARGGEGTHAS